MVKKTITEVQRQRQRRVMAWKQIMASDELKPAVDWLMKLYDSPMIPSERIPLERQAGRRDVVRDILLMVKEEMDDVSTEE